MGKALTTNLRFAEAAAILNRAVQSAPRSLEANLALADLQYEIGTYGAALVQYRKCLDIEPDCVSALVKGGQAAIAEKQNRLPVEWLQKATKLAPQSADAWIGMGRAYYNQGLRHDKALQAYQTAERLAPERTDYFHRYAEVLRVNYKFDEAIALLRRRLAVEPTDARCHSLLATHLLDYKQSAATVKEAELALRRAIALKPDMPAPQLRLGQLLLEQDRPKEALPFLQRALALDPYNLNASTLLARTYRRVGNMAEARVAAKNAEGLGHYLKMRRTLEDKERQAPEDPKIHQQLVKLYTAGKEMDKARRQMDMLDMLKNNPEEARRAIKALSDATVAGIGVESRPPAQSQRSSNKLASPSTGTGR
ncbi:MAG: hypothetical protein JWN98_467 [Abditibacteriota bacterium]|nr:hypothetical protein [Abditibacteriota bacterium]